MRKGNLSLNRTPKRKWSKSNPLLEDLEVLVGEWNFIGAHPMLPAPVRGQAFFEWIEDGAFLQWRTDYENPGPPSGIAVIGRDDPSEPYSMLYFDERGVSRVYRMSLEGAVWKMWRDFQGFSQRMTGSISEDRKTITIHGEKSSDGSHWEPDLDLVYQKVK